MFIKIFLKYFVFYVAHPCFLDSLLKKTYDLLARDRKKKDPASSPVFLAKEKLLYPNYNKT